MTQQTGVKPIETRYKSCRFRSRLEARWAVFFDWLDVKWHYEYEGYAIGDAYYLPDFWLPAWGCWFEVKAKQPTEDEIRKLAALPGPAYFLAGYPGDAGDPGDPKYEFEALGVEMRRRFGEPA